MNNTTIHVVGDLLLDCELQARSRENYEGASVCLTGEQWVYYPGGAANVACLLRTFGCDVVLWGVVGPDWAAEKLVRILTQCGVEHEQSLGALAVQTPTKMRTYADGLTVRIDCEHPFPTAWPLSEFEEIGKGADCVVFSDYNKGVFGPHVKDEVQSIIKKVPLTVVDPRPTDYLDIWEGATVATPNRREYFEMCSNVQRCGYAKEASFWIESKYLAVTNGEDGAEVSGQGIAVITRKPRHVENPQVVGAGDAFTAGLSAALAKGETIIGATQQGVDFATDYVSKSRNEVYHFPEK